MRWYRKATASTDDLSGVADAIEYFQAQYEEARGELDVRGQRIDQVASRIPGLLEHRFAQYREIESIMEWLDKLRERAVMTEFQRVQAHYGRKQSDANYRKIADIADEVWALDQIRIEIGAVRDNFHALFKGLEALHFQIRNIVELRKIGLDEATF